LIDNIPVLLHLRSHKTTFLGEGCSIANMFLAGIHSEAVEIWEVSKIESTLASRHVRSLTSTLAHSGLHRKGTCASTDGTKLAVACEGGGMVVWDVSVIADAAEMCVCIPDDLHGESVLDHIEFATFSADGSLLIATIPRHVFDDDGQLVVQPFICVWDVANSRGREAVLLHQLELSIHVGAANCVYAYTTAPSAADIVSNTMLVWCDTLNSLKTLYLATTGSHPCPLVLCSCQGEFIRMCISSPSSSSGNDVSGPMIGLCLIGDENRHVFKLIPAIQSVPYPDSNMNKTIVLRETVLDVVAMNFNTNASKFMALAHCFEMFVNVWDVSTGAKLCSIVDFSSSLPCSCFLSLPTEPEGEMVAVADGLRMKYFDATTGNRIGTELESLLMQPSTIHLVQTMLTFPQSSVILM
jgi:hypothetical protein